MTQPFYFPDGSSAYNAEDLLELCERYPDDGINYLVRADLEKWLVYIGSPDIAECAATARQTDMGDREKLTDFLNRCHALTMPKTSAKKVVEFTISETSAQQIAESVPAKNPAQPATPEVSTKAPESIAPVAKPVAEPVAEPVVKPAPEAKPEITATSEVIPVADSVPEVKSAIPAPVEQAPAPKVSATKTVTPPTNVPVSQGESKPSFFRLIAGLIARILS